MLLATSNSKLKQHWFKRQKCSLLIIRKPEGSALGDSIISARNQTPLLSLPYSSRCVGNVSPHSHKMVATGPDIRSSCHSSKQQGRGLMRLKRNLSSFTQEKVLSQTVPSLHKVGQTSVQALPHPHNLSEPQFPHAGNGNNSSIFLIGCCEI